jgi:gas vesicle protein
MPMSFMPAAAHLRLTACFCYAVAFFKRNERSVSVMAEESRSYGLAWFLAGLGVGALVGILYAPKSGRETREDLANSAREGTEYLRNCTRKAAEEVSALVDKSKEQVSEYVDRGREAVDRGRAQWEEFVERGKNLVSDQTGRVTAAVDAGRQAYKTATDVEAPKEY